MPAIHKIGDAEDQPKQPQKRRSGKRAVALSRIDRERLQRGELLYPEQALTHQESSASQTRANHSTRAGRNTYRQTYPPASGLNREDLTPREREILENLPPHFGKI
ncbi:MAG: hypothetical protein PUK59_02435 [Actinomycetaceae bacterium]|nr:hypothetical protein [Actinomycetaceae bacterium]